MSRPDFIAIDGKLIRWRDLVAQRREQLRPHAELAQPTLFKLNRIAARHPPGVSFFGYNPNILENRPKVTASVIVRWRAEEGLTIRGLSRMRVTKDSEALLAFHDSPAEHRDHLRTTNPIESVFATVRLRSVRTKGSLSPTAAKMMVFKLVVTASNTWRRLKGTNQLPKIVAGVRFTDGIEAIQVPANHAA